MMTLMILSLAVVVGIAYNFAFCMIFEKIDVKKFHCEEVSRYARGE